MLELNRISLRADDICWSCFDEIMPTGRPDLKFPLLLFKDSSELFLLDMSRPPEDRLFSMFVALLCKNLLDLQFVLLK